MKFVIANAFIKIEAEVSCSIKLVAPAASGWSDILFMVHGMCGAPLFGKDLPGFQWVNLYMVVKLWLLFPKHKTVAACMVNDKSLIITYR